MHKISVCIPVYNAEKYLEETMDAVLQQTYQEFELLLINDCSTDGSAAVIEKKEDPRIRFITNEKNLGMHGTMNRCIQEASGDYILILCDDDLISKDCLEKKAAILDKYPKVSFVFSASSIINEDGKVMMHRHPFKKSDIFAGKEIARKSFEKKNVFAEPSNVLFRKSAAMKLDGFDVKIKYAIDWEYWLRLCSLGNVYYINEELSSFRISNTSETGRLIKIRESIFEEDKYFVEKMRNFKALGFKESSLKKHTRNVKIRQYMKEVFFKLKR